MADVYPQSPAPLKDLEARLQSETPDLDALVITTCEYLSPMTRSSLPAPC